MYFGMTHAARRLRNDRISYQLWWVWCPVRMKDGRWVWWDYVWRFWTCDKLAPTNCGWIYHDYNSDILKDA